MSLQPQPLWETVDWPEPVQGSLESDTERGSRASFPVTVVETPDAVVVHADLPGMNPEDVQVELQGDRLTIRASKRTETPGAAAASGREGTGGEFLRSFSLGISVQGEAVTAGYEGGVLTVRLPKAPAARPLRVPVEVGAS